MNRLRQLDGIRGCAILCVLVWHYYALILKVPAGTFLYLTKFWLGLTWGGVDLFFVLSGFLITGILLENANASNYFTIFYLRRACRILPVYCLTILAFVIVMWAWGDKLARFFWLKNDVIPLWGYVTFTQNIFMGFKSTWGTDLLAPTWSLAVEEQFYLFLPLAVYFVPRRVLPCLLVGLIILAPLLRATTTSVVHCYVQTPWRADALIGGALLAWCVRQTAILQFFVAQQRWLYLIFSGVLAGAVFVTWRGPRIGGTIDHLVLAALSALLILLAYIDGEGRLARVLRCRVLVWLGTLSYGIYLFHQPVSAGLHAWRRGAMPAIVTLEDALIACLALVVTLLLAAGSFRLIERRWIDFGHKFRYRTESVEAGVLGPALQPMGK
jgi:peptidoglycan/LPS O-acetylase OafA/YrhL